MEALEPGKPLSFLDHHIQPGNSLLGATPKLLAEGGSRTAPAEPIDGDDPTSSSYSRTQQPGTEEASMSFQRALSEQDQQVPGFPTAGAA